jgi:hypothetical protein
MRVPCAAGAAGLMPAPLIATEWGDRQFDDDWGRDSSRSRGRSRGSDGDWDAEREPGWGRRSRGGEEATASVFVKVRGGGVLHVFGNGARPMMPPCAVADATATSDGDAPFVTVC